MINWKKGGGEVIGFLCIVPIVIFMFSVLITTLQVGKLKERLEYVAYKACRQAVVCKDRNKDGDYMDDALEAAQDVTELEFERRSPDAFDNGTYTTELTLLSAEGEDEEDVVWEKGRYVKCTISVDATTPLAFMSGTKYASIVMMIESPANEGGEYPWFKDM